LTAENNCSVTIDDEQAGYKLYSIIFGSVVAGQYRRMDGAASAGGKGISSPEKAVKRQSGAASPATVAWSG
jgi:hypothetical protein